MASTISDPLHRVGAVVDGAAQSALRADAAPGGRFSRALEFRPWLEAVAQISAAVNNMEPLGNVLNAIAATTCGLLGYDFGAVLLADRERLFMRGSHGLASSYIETINSEKPIRLGHGPFGEGPSSRAFRSHKPVVVGDYLEDPSVGPWAGVAIEQGFRSLAAIPLVVSGRAIGTLNNYTRDVHEFGADELLLLQTIANQAALAIETARLREQERASIARLEAARRSLQEQAGVLERSEEIHSQLTRAVLDGAGLPAIAEALTRILTGSVVIDDGRGVVHAAAAHGDSPAVVPEPALSDRAFGERLGRRLDARKPLELTTQDHPALRQRTFVAPIVIGHEMVGRLWVRGSDRYLGALETRALEHGTTVVALELLKQRIASEVEGRLAGELLGDLLGDRALDRQTARIRAAHLGHDLNCRHAAVVVDLDRSTDSMALELRPARNRQLLTLVNLLLRRHHQEALVGEIEGRITLLVSEPTKRGTPGIIELGDAIRREVRSYIQGATASVAVGPLSDDVAGYPRSYRIARGAIELSQGFGRPDRTVSADSLGIHGLLLSVDRIDELVRFSRATLDPLRSYDERRSSELVSTLAAYLAHGCRPGETSEALVVHPNTVAYRIRRIETLLGVDLGQPEAQLRAQLALVVDDIIGTQAAEDTATA
jgi:GAF domain-containing protein/sugar diacid utilization regulator